MAGTTNKVFVGGLSQSVTDDKLSDYFSQFGKLTDSVVMKDRETGNSRGFGFVTYEDSSSVDEVMDRYKEHNICDKWIEVKRATPEGSKGSANRGRGDDRGRDSDTRPGDWRCPGCGSNVYASKDTCFKCGDPKPRSSPYGGPPPYGYGMPPYGYPGYGYPYGMPPAYGAYPGFPGADGRYSPYDALPPPAYGGGPPLPPGWEMAHDPASGNPYYFNRSLNQTTWTRPE